MRGIRVGPLVVPMIVAALARPAASDDCRQEEIDAEGKCPPKRPVVPPAPKPTPPLRTSPPPPRTPPATTTARTPPTAPPPATARSESCPDGMVRVPAGTFQMGSPDGKGNDDEYPQHAVTLSGYCIDKTEVTVKAYAACVAARGCSARRMTARDVASFDLCNGNDRPDHPVNCVDWNQSVAYCKWAKKRLPTEAEWEYAARGTDGRVYPWGNEAPSAKLLNACGSECVAMKSRQPGGSKTRTPMYNGDDGWESTAPVGRFPDGKSPFGVLDMAGNVWEWTADKYRPYTEEAVTNPQGGTVGTRRVFRGGSWDYEMATFVRAARRHFADDPANSSHNLGFRCARGE